MYLGLELGTSGVKALLIDDRQHVIGSAHGIWMSCALTPAGANRILRIGSRHVKQRLMTCVRPIRKSFQPSVGSDYQARCMVQLFSMKTISCRAPVFSVMTLVAIRELRS